MSLINDALKQARQNPPSDTPPSAPPPMTPLQPAAHNPVPVAGWLIPAIVIFLIVAAVFFMGWAMANRSVSSKVVASPPPAAAGTGRRRRPRAPRQRRCRRQHRRPARLRSAPGATGGCSDIRQRGRTAGPPQPGSPRPTSGACVDSVCASTEPSIRRRSTCTTSACAAPVNTT